MFLKKSSVNEFLQEVEQNLINNAHAEKKEAFNQLIKAANILDNIGQTKLAEEVTQILTLLVEATDPATKNLTPDKMVNNLKNKGWVFNADDKKQKKVEKDEDLEVSEDDEKENK